MVELPLPRACKKLHAPAANMESKRGPSSAPMCGYMWLHISLGLYLAGQGDLVSMLITPLRNPVILIVGLLTKSP